MTQICEHDRQRYFCKDCKKLGKGGEGVFSLKYICQRCVCHVRHGFFVVVMSDDMMTSKDCVVTKNHVTTCVSQICEHDCGRRFCERCPGDHKCVHDIVLYNCAKCHGRPLESFAEPHTEDWQRCMSRVEEYMGQVNAQPLVKTHVLSSLVMLPGGS